MVQNSTVSDIYEADFNKQEMKENPYFFVNEFKLQVRIRLQAKT